MNEMLQIEFWKELQEKYPLGLKVFTDWLDEYKAKIGWYSLFRVKPTGRMRKHIYDLPEAMQIGIWIEFNLERGGCNWEIEDMFSHDWETDIRESMKMFQEEKEPDNKP